MVYNFTHNYVIHNFFWNPPPRLLSVKTLAAPSVCSCLLNTVKLLVIRKSAEIRAAFLMMELRCCGRRRRTASWYGGNIWFGAQRILMCCFFSSVAETFANVERWSRFLLTESRRWTTPHVAFAHAAPPLKDASPWAKFWWGASSVLDNSRIDSPSIPLQ